MATCTLKKMLAGWLQPAIVSAMIANSVLCVAQAGKHHTGSEPAKNPDVADSQGIYQAGMRPDGSVVLPVDQVIHPVGRLIPFEGRPTALAIRPDGRTAAVLKSSGTYMNSSDHAEHIVIIDLSSGQIKQRFLPDGLAQGAWTLPYKTAQGSFIGILYSADGNKLYASDASGSVIVSDVAEDGSLTTATRIALPVADPRRGAGFFKPEGRNTASPGGLALSKDGRRLYVALNMNNSLAVVDLKENKVVEEIPVGNAPHSVLVDGSRAYVTNEGGRPAAESDYTNQSAGTPIVADPATGRPTTGTISVVDLTAGKVVASIPVGLGPTAMLLHQRDLFVANTNSDTISVVDAASLSCVKTISVQPFSHAPFGSSPNALAMLPKGRLAVSLGAANAVAIYQWAGPSATPSLLGLIPTPWYPGDLAFDGKRNRLVVTALKGLGVEQPLPSAKNVLKPVGSVSLVTMPTREELLKQTHEVIVNNRWNTGLADHPQPSTNAAAKAVPDHIGDPSLIKHIIYIIKENKTYDQVLGDDSRGNRDPKLVMFGQPITPNEHALAVQFPLLDNFYVGSLASFDGHAWANAAFVTDYLERGYTAGFQRSYPFNGGDSLAYSPSGFIWEDALRHGKSVRVFGEFASRFDGPREHFGQWSDWYRDSQIMEGKVEGSSHTRAGEFKAKADIPSLDAVLNRDFPPYDTHIPDQYRADIFLADFRRRVANHDLPDLTIMTLCDDHTSGVEPGTPAPRAQIADNDLAFGRVVEAISNSPYWQNTAIFVVEDDAAGGLDHVDGHRSPAFVISPYARHGYVDRTYYTQIDVVRTIEQMLGLPPMNQHDLAAAPMSTAFTDSPDLTPYKALPNESPLDEMNPVKSASRFEKAWGRESAKMFAAWPPIPDSPDNNLLNRAIWYSLHSYALPYPGDDRVLMPSEVPRSKRVDND